MNKTLLIVICDFLLLSMLGMISFDDLPTKQQEPTNDLLPYADSQLLDLLKMSLDKEREQRDDLTSKVDEYSAKTKEVEDISKEQALELLEKQNALNALEIEKQKALDLAEQERLTNLKLEEEKSETLASAKALELELQGVSFAKENLEAENAKTIAQAKDLELKLQSQALAKQNLEEKLGIMSENDTLLKARLEAMQAELEQTKANAESLKAENTQIQKKSEELSTQLEVANTKANIFKDDLERTQSLVWQEKTEKQQLQEHAQSLAKGVDKLADTQEKLSKQVEEIRPLSASEIYETYKANVLDIDISYKRNSVFGDGLAKKTIRSAVVEIKGEYWALFSAEGTPFDRATDKFFAPETLEITPKAKAYKFNLSALYYMRGSRDILALRVPKAFIENTKLKVYAATDKPFKYSEATIIDTSDLYYGQVKYNVDEKYSSLAKVDTNFFASLLGDFSPSRGDFVFDRAGSFVGIMTTSSNLLLARAFSVSAPLPLLDNYTKANTKAFFEAMKSGR